MIISFVLAIILMMNSCNGQTREPVVRPATQANRFYEGICNQCLTRFSPCGMPAFG